MKILLCGACGRMGRAVSELCEERGEEIVCGVDLSPSPMPYPVYRSLAEVGEGCDVVIDFSSARGLCERLAFAEERKLPVLLAATGFSEPDLALIRKSAKKIPVFRAENLSVGIALLKLLAERAARALGEGFDVEIVERHHRQKKDAPSGTALLLAESVKRAGARENVYGRHGREDVRKRGEIGIHAVRGGTIAGEHEVMFAGEDEIVTLSHSVRSRRVFAAGALRAAEWLLTRPAGLYGMGDLLKGTL